MGYMICGSYPSIPKAIFYLLKGDYNISGRGLLPIPAVRSFKPGPCTSLRPAWATVCFRDNGK